MDTEDKKMALSGWLQQNCRQLYISPMKLQNFLFLYDAFAKADGEDISFEGLYGFPAGPVYKSIYERQKSDAISFNHASAQEFKYSRATINEERAEQAGFVIQLLNADELSELFQKFNIWASKKDLIGTEERDVRLNHEDFNASDLNLAKGLGNLYPLDMVRNSMVIHKSGVSFVFSSEDATRLSCQQQETLDKIAMSGPGPFGNPLFAKIDSDGILIID